MKKRMSFEVVFPFLKSEGKKKEEKTTKKNSPTFHVKEKKKSEGNEKWFDVSFKTINETKRKKVGKKEGKMDGEDDNFGRIKECCSFFILCLLFTSS